MLAGLLPGLRQIRAPLSAGYIWLVVAWLVFEPVVPDRANSNGVVASLYRAGDVVSVLGLGIAVSFAAYLLGALSSSTLTPLLRCLFPRAWPLSEQSIRTPPSPLSPQAKAALSQIARTTLEQLKSSLALSATDVDRFLEDQTDVPLPDVGIRSRQRFQRRSTSKVLADKPVGPGYAQPVDIDARREWLLALAVLRDLNVVATTRLLGRDQELYSAVDRNRAEVEFRLAVVPALLVLVISLGARSGPWLLAVLAPLGAILAWALFADAVRSERAANEILLDSIADRRVQSPTLERLETRAAALASQTQPELMSTAAKDAALALQGAASSLERVLVSEPSLATYARRQTGLAQESVNRVGRLFPPPVAHTADEALRLLSEMAEAWVNVIDGHGAPEFDTQAHSDRARQLLADFQTQARKAVEKAKDTALEPLHQAEDAS